MKRLFAVLAAAMTFASTATGATALTIEGGKSVTILATGSDPNDLLGPLGLGASAHGYVGATLSGAAKTYRYDFMGYEAWWDNRFTIGSAEAFSNRGTPRGKPGTVLATAFGDLTFAFDVHARGTGPSNGTNPGPNGSTFFATCAGTTSRECRSVTLFLNDSGSSDGDYDDMVVTVAAVPVPASLTFLVVALGGLAALGRRVR